MRELNILKSKVRRIGNEVIRQTLRLEGREGAGVSVAFLSEKQMRSLNRRWLGRDAPCDVIAFGASREGDFLGDVAVSPEVALRRAREFEIKPQEELALYIVHGILHLLGYDDTTKASRAKMEKRQWQILKKIRRKIPL